MTENSRWTDDSSKLEVGPKGLEVNQEVRD